MGREGVGQRDCGDMHNSHSAAAEAGTLRENGRGEDEEREGARCSYESGADFKALAYIHSTNINIQLNRAELDSSSRSLSVMLRESWGGGLLPPCPSFMFRLCGIHR